MADDEKYGDRNLTYSAWHRAASTQRFAGDAARLLTMIDMDHVLWIEYEDENKWPLALIEEAQDVGQAQKPSTVTQHLAMMARLPALVVLWKPAETTNPANDAWPDIAGFRVRRIYPVPESKWWELTPKEYAQMLLRMRSCRSKELDAWLFGEYPK